jgi:protein-L-isoaspartate(D-aspartate) O-methyltransferase
VGVLRSPQLEAAFRSVDRRFFVPENLREEAYEDYPLPIGHGQTISQPTTAAFMLEKLDARPGQKILDVGSGSGWTTALLASLAGPKGKVIGLEIIPELVALGKANLRAFYSTIRANGGITSAAVSEIREAREGMLGLPEEAPFDRILVSAAAEKFPNELMNQLVVGGRLVIPIRDSIWVVEKTGKGEESAAKYPGFAFVPLV